jgi:hypothetical protein
MTVKRFGGREIFYAGICALCISTALSFQKESYKASSFKESLSPQATPSPVANQSPAQSPSSKETQTDIVKPLTWPPIVQAIVALIAFLFSVFWALYERREKKKAETAQTEAKKLGASLQQINLELDKKVESERVRAEQAEESLRKIGGELKNRIGYHIDKVEIKIYIDVDGNCHSRWFWGGISKTRSDVPLSRIPGKIRFSTPGALFKQYPTLSSEYKKKCEIEFIRQDSNLCEFQVKLKDTDSEFSYEYIADIDNAFCMSAEDLTELLSYKYEWFGLYINSVIENLVIKISFPSQYSPDDIQPCVCIGLVPAIESIDNSEVGKMRQGFKNAPGDASVSVTQPKIGYLYFIRWKPLPKRNVEMMKTST